MRSYFELAAKPIVIGVSFVATAILLFVFTTLPVDGELLDVRQGYGFDEAMGALAGYGADGRQTYAWASATLDTLLPIAYATFLAGVVYRFRPREALGRLAWLPVALGVLDLFENAQIILMLISYPDVSSGQVALASAFTSVKNAVFPACFALAVVLAAWSGVRRAMRRRPA